MTMSTRFEGLNEAEVAAAKRPTREPKSVTSLQDHTRLSEGHFDAEREAGGRTDAR